jgi:hypothetical protein
MILHSIQGKIGLDTYNRVIYSDGSLGSSLIDLLRYFVMPSTLRVPTPLDSPDFYQLLIDFGTPQSAFGNQKNQKLPNNEKIRHGKISKVSTNDSSKSTSIRKPPEWLKY